METSYINLTDAAANHVKAFLAKQGSSADGLRIGIKPAGCSGHQYVIEAIDKITEHDTTFESRGIKIVVDAQSLGYLAGCKLDFVRKGLNSGFKFSNPNVQETCGCGESFSLKDEVKG